MNATTDLEPTVEDREEMAEQAHAIDQTIKDALHEGRKALWRVAEGIYAFDELVGWQWLGYETKSEWLADPEISMSSTTYYRLLGVWRELAVLRKVDPDEFTGLDVSKVAIVLPRLQMGKTKLKEALDDAEALGTRDLREKYIAPRSIARTAVDDDDDVIDSIETEPAHPPEDMWDEVVAKAKSRRRNLVTYITQQRDWEKIGDGDGTSREDWVIPDTVGTPEDDDDHESPAPSAAQNGSEGRAMVDKAIVKQALTDWKALCKELLAAAESGQANPRIDVRLIRAGVQGANLLIEQRRNNSDERDDG